MVDDGSDLEGDDAETGYCKPPRSERFQKGQSGNPAGRPRGSKNKVRMPANLRSLMLEEAYRPIRMVAEGMEVTMPLMQAAVRSLVEAAANGDARAQALLFKMMSASEDAEVEIESMLETARKEAGPRTIEFRIVDPKVDNGKPRPFSFGPAPQTKP